jgi:hypothetical protein
MHNKLFEKSANCKSSIRPDLREAAKLSGEMTNTFRVGRVICEMTFTGRRLSARWSPQMPRPGEFSNEDLKWYRARRDALLAEVAAVIGAGVLVIE